MIGLNKKIIIQFCIVTFFFFVVFIINAIPHDFFIAGGDFYQVIDPATHLSRYFYAWINQIGQGAFNSLSMTFPFYGILAFLNFLGFDSGTIASFQMFFILYCSYLSFYFSAKILFPNLRNNIRIGGSLLYALNNFTFTLFVYPWSFTHHVLFYIFIPLLISLFFEIFSKKEFVFRTLVLFALFFLLSTISYNNIAFFAVLILVQFLIFLMLFTLGKIKLDFVLIKKIVSVSLIYLIGAVYFLIPFYLANSDYQNKIMHTAALGGNVLNIIKVTSNSILSIFQLDINSFNSQPNKLNLLYPLILFFFFFVYAKSDRKKPIIVVLSALLVLLVFFAVRLHEPFIFLNSLLFKTTFFALFRSQDKIFLMLPFFYIMLLVGLLYQLKLRKVYVYFTFFILLLIPYKFYIGGITDALSKSSGSVEENYSLVIKIPDEYYKAKEVINKEKNSQSIISLPYSVVNSLNWSNYPKWHFIGHDVLHLLYNKNYISANTYDHPVLETQLSFKNFNERKGSPEELLYLIKKFSGQFVFFHKDITADWIIHSLPTKNALEELRRKRQLDLVISNDYFDLYEVKEENLVTLIYSSATEFFKKINPSKYRIILQLKNKESITFNQSHSSQWKLYLSPHPSDPWCQPDELDTAKRKQLGAECQEDLHFFEGEELSYLWKKSVFDDSHKLVNQYANQWTIDTEYIKQNFSKEYYKENSDGSIKIELILYFKPQSYFYLGLIISGITLVLCLGYLGHDFIKRRKKR